MVQDRHLNDGEDVIYDATMISYPGSSFTPARDNRDGQENDPKLLRGPLSPEIYGLKDLCHDEKLFRHEGMTLASIGANTARLMRKSSRPWV